MTELRFEIHEAERVHRPDLEQRAYNQMPKDKGWTELKLWQFGSTDLFQWRGRKRVPGLDGYHYYVWDDQATEVFRIAEIV